LFDLIENISFGNEFISGLHNIGGIVILNANLNNAKTISLQYLLPHNLLPIILYLPLLLAIIMSALNFNSNQSLALNNQIVNLIVANVNVFISFIRGKDLFEEGDPKGLHGVMLGRLWG
jgi:hypothetical protein